MQKLIFGNSDKNHFTLIRIGNLTYLVQNLAIASFMKILLNKKLC
jgi:hypothetical protein